MIKFVACTLPKKNNPQEIFVEYNELIWWFTYDSNEEGDNQLICGMKPGRDIAECTEWFGRGFGKSVSSEYTQYITDDIKTKILSYILKNKQKFLAQSEWLKKIIEESQNL